MSNPAAASSTARNLFAGILIGSLAASTGLTVFMFSRVTTLKKENTALAAESKKLVETMATLEEQNKSFNEKIAAIEKERDNLKEALDGFRSENQNLQTDLAKINESLGSAKEEKTFLEEMLINKNKELTEIRNNTYAPAASSASSVSGDVAEQLKQKDQEIQKLAEYNKVLAQKLERIYKTTNEKISQINVAKMTLEETIAEARKILDNEWNSVDLGNIEVEQPAKSAPVKKQTVTAPSKKDSRKSKKEGKVLAINEEHGFVVVDLGKVDNVKNDSVIFLKQNGQDVAKLSVLEVRDVMTACNIQPLNPAVKININDPVLIS